MKNIMKTKQYNMVFMKNYINNDFENFCFHSQKGHFHPSLTVCHNKIAKGRIFQMEFFEILPINDIFSYFLTGNE